MTDVEKISSAVDVLGVIYSKQLSPAVIAVYVNDLLPYGAESVLRSIEKCRTELRYFPTIADILSRIPDGHPGPEEAWNMCPKHESCSVVWTQEMAQAFGACSNLIETDEVAARMAFLEKYRALLSDARFRKSKPVWQASLGHDQSGRESALKEAVQLGRLSAATAQALLPRPENLSLVPEQKLLEVQDQTVSPEKAAEYIKQTLARIRGVK